MANLTRMCVVLFMLFPLTSFTPQGVIDPACTVIETVTPANPELFGWRLPDSRQADICGVVFTNGSEDFTVLAGENITAGGYLVSWAGPNMFVAQHVAAGPVFTQAAVYGRPVYRAYIPIIAR